MAVRSKTHVFGRLIAGIVGSNPAEGMDVCLLCLLSVVLVAASATGWSPVQRDPTRCVWVSNCVWSRNINTERA